jgi:hypothetical protein
MEEQIINVVQYITIFVLFTSFLSTVAIVVVGSLVQQ